MRYEIHPADLMDMFRHPDHETQALLTDLGLIFLELRAEAADTKIHRRQNRLASMHGASAESMEDDELLAIYRKEQDLIQELIVSSNEKPFVQVVPSRLDTIRRVLNHQGRGWTTDSKLRAARYQIHVEQNILVDLLRGWRAWLRSSHYCQD